MSKEKTSTPLDRWPVVKTGGVNNLPTVINADNEMDQRCAEGPWVIDEVNGLGAREVPFVPTRHELLQIAT